MRIISGVKDEEFIGWLHRTGNAFVDMIQTMKDVAKVVEENTVPITPFETGKLGRSFKRFVLTDNAKTKLIMIRMSALNPNTGYDYAWIQHENPNYTHSKRLGSESARHKRWGAHGYSYIPIFYTNHQGRMFYLKEGIETSEEDALILIEEDYLSLFTRGSIY